MRNSAITPMSQEESVLFARAARATTEQLIADSTAIIARTSKLTKEIPEIAGRIRKDTKHAVL